MMGFQKDSESLTRRRMAIVAVAVLCTYACLLLHSADHDAKPADSPCVMCALSDQPVSLGSPVAGQILPAPIDPPCAPASVLTGAGICILPSARGPPAFA